MKTSLLMFLVGLAALVITASASESLPGDINGYYRDFNELTLRELQPAQDNFSAPQAFTLQASSPVVRAVQLLRQRLLERRPTIDPQFHRGAVLVPSHERVFIRVMARARRSGDQLAVQCEVYEPAFPLPDVSTDLEIQTALAALDFTRLKLLRRETQQWRQAGGEWRLHGAIQELARVPDRSR